MGLFQAQSACGRDPASFRDPAGYVFHRTGRVFRAIDGASRCVLRNLADDPAFADLWTDGLLASCHFVDDAEFSADLAADHSGHLYFLEHDPIQPITYPYEWSVSMLADAAILTLNLQMRLIKGGYSLKDATAYNVQFVDGRPVFIDHLSIERPNRLDIWPALGQFSQMFLFALLLCVRYRWDVRTYFLANPAGLPAERVAAIVGTFGRLRPSMWLDVTLPWLLGRTSAGERLDTNEMLERSNRNTAGQMFNLKRLRSKVEKLASRYRPQGSWTTYTSTCRYGKTASEQKLAAVREFLLASRPAAVLDLGCNTGEFSFLASECGAAVVAVDADHDAIEVLYRSLRENPARITPMVVDLSSPSPGIGFRNCERRAFHERVDGDCVLALALVHHLMVTENLPVAAIRDMLWEMTRDSLVLEFVPHDDVMFKELLKRRVGEFRPVFLNAFLDIFGERFQLIRQVPLPGSTRTLLFMRRRY